MKDYHGITTGTIVSVTVSNMGITGTKTTDSEILEQWNSFIKEAKYKPKCIFIYGTKPNWVKIVMSTGEKYFFERWAYFENGHYLYQFDDSESAKKVFDLVLHDPKGVDDSWK